MGCPAAFCEICRRISVLCEGKTDRVGKKTLFHWPDADFRYVGQFPGQSVDVGFLFDFAVMVGVEDRGTDRLDCIHGLIDRHRVGLIDGQEGDVDAMQGFHFGCIFPVSGDVDACTSDSQDVTAILSFAGVELLTVFGGVVGRNSFDREVVARGERIARLHRQALASQRFAAGPVAHDGCGCGGESGDGRAVQMVVVRVGNEDQIGLGQRRIVGVLADRIDVNMAAFGFDGQRCVFEKGNRQLTPVLRGQRVRGIRCRLVLASRNCKCRHNGENEKFRMFHKRGV